MSDLVTSARSAVPLVLAAFVQVAAAQGTLDAQTIADEVAQEAKDHLGEPGLVFLIEALGCLDARIRAARCLRDLAAYTPANGSSPLGH